MGRIMDVRLEKGLPKAPDKLFHASRNPKNVTTETVATNLPDARPILITPFACGAAEAAPVQK
jgi:hypothetical protein